MGDARAVHSLRERGPRALARPRPAGRRRGTGHAARSAACAGADDVPVASSLAAARSATLCLVNAERTSRGLRALRTNDGLQRAARGHSQDMVKRRYFDHVSPGGVDPVRRLTKVHYITSRVSWAIGENLGSGDGSEATPRASVIAWMNSPPHRVNMLNPAYRDAGIGVQVGLPEQAPLPGATYTIDFGRRTH